MNLRRIAGQASPLYFALLIWLVLQGTSAAWLFRDSSISLRQRVLQGRLDGAARYPGERSPIRPLHRQLKFPCCRRWTPQSSRPRNLLKAKRARLPERPMATRKKL